ncbi:WD40/YVTN/BNR-like repeat-containing protein [Gemmatimonadota bacterium]
MSELPTRGSLLVPTLLLGLSMAVGLPQPAAAQSSSGGEDPNVIIRPELFETLEYRFVGPHRGGRSTAVTGVPGDPFRFFQGTTGGGVWVTTDAGESWKNVSDGFIEVGSIGAVEVALSDANVIYVGTGSACIRGNVSAGDGVYRSTDAGRTWSLVGLEESGAVGSIQVHPSNPDLVYVAALGHPFGKNPERGVFRSSDGGETWEHVLALSDSVGAVDLVMNPENPRILFAGMWRAERKPWTLVDASEDGGVYRSTDGGDTWEKLEKGLPTGLIGRIGVAVSPANPDRIWAQVNAHDPQGGIYRSDDGGDSWTRVNRNRKLRQRAWYYSHLVADPQDENTLYAMNTSLYRSVDGGRTFQPIRVPHGDVHDLWVNPDNPDLMVVADDGGGSGEPESWRELVHLDEPAYRRAVSRDGGQPVPLSHLRRPAGQLHHLPPQPASLQRALTHGGVVPGGRVRERPHRRGSEGSRRGVRRVLHR